MDRDARRLPPGTLRRGRQPRIGNLPGPGPHSRSVHSLVFNPVSSMTLYTIRMLSRGVALAGGALMVPLFVAAQDGAAPPGWQVRLDRTEQAAPDEVSFVEMAPGWHVTTGPAAILYDGGTRAAGDYRIESEIFLFDPGERNEGFGVFFGGTDLDAVGRPTPTSSSAARANSW